MLYILAYKTYSLARQSYLSNIENRIQFGVLVVGIEQVVLTSGSILTFSVLCDVQALEIPQMLFREMLESAAHRLWTMAGAC